MLEEMDQQIKILGIEKGVVEGRGAQNAKKYDVGIVQWKADHKWLKDELLKKCCQKTHMASDVKELVEAKQEKFEKESEKMLERL